MTAKSSVFVLGAVTLLLAGSPSLFAAERGALVREAIIYLSPDTDSAKLGNVERGRELIVLDASRGWLHVEALFGPEKTITGWIQEKGVVRSTTPQGDLILYGEAVNSEDQGSRRHGRKGAADDARRLYYRVYDYFPNSPVAGEALYRAADIQWQIDRADVLSRPSAREQEHYLREGIDEQWMKLVMKKYPGTKWADLAAFHLIDNKLCGDWQGASKCPDKEADVYEKYVKEHPQSPSAAEALYDAASRRAALVEIYKTEEQPKKSEESKKSAIALAQQLVSQYSQSDWAARGQALLFLLQQGVPTYGNAID
jgi:outer membrane protein assembly factor BamD (BamD/ComL family)